MNHDKDKWMEEVFDSMKSSQRATPSPDLFAKIEEQIETSSGKVISINQWKYAVAAAVLILLINASALIYYNQQDGKYQDTYEDLAVADNYDQSLISSFQIYE